MPSTFVICKPDAVRRGLVGQILARFEARGFTLARVELRTIDSATAERHYAEHVGKPFFGDLVAFITSGPSVLAVVEGPGEVWATVRLMMGATDPQQAAPGTIRGDWGLEMPDNLIHGSDSAASAAREIALFFP